MKSPVAKHMNTYNKASVVRHKHVSMREAVSLQEMEEDAAQSVLEGFIGDIYSFAIEDGGWYYYPQIGKVSDKTLSKFCVEN